MSPLDVQTGKTIERVVYSIIGLLIGCGYGIGVSIGFHFDRWTTAVATVFGAGLLAYWGYMILQEPCYSPLKRIVVLALAPVAFVGSLIGVMVGAMLFGFLYPCFCIQNVLTKRKFQQQMRATGRFITCEELVSSLEAGQGTLIEESLGAGPIRIWYTQEDVLARGQPICTDEELLGVLSHKLCHVFNAWCLRRYLDPESGIALLTDIRPKQARAGRIPKELSDMQRLRLVRPLGPFSEIDLPASAD
jgi:hypothetical protein